MDRTSWHLIARLGYVRVEPRYEEKEEMAKRGRTFTECVM